MTSLGNNQNIILLFICVGVSRIILVQQIPFWDLPQDVVEMDLESGLPPDRGVLLE
jgi:hypothetical protein